MTPEEFEQYLNTLSKECKEYILNKAPKDAAEIAKRHFKENFETESFEGNKWQEVKRRNPASKWYGYNYDTRGHFSERRTQDKILHDTGALSRSFEAPENTKYYPGEAHIVSNLPYSEVHNEGGQAKVFGKYSFTMPKRQFMGESERLHDDIMDKINYEMNEIINNKTK